jgi:hypothetical protein
MAAGPGTAIVAGSPVASADTPTAEASTEGTTVGDQSKRRRATFAPASVTEVKFDDLNASGNKKP